MKVSNKNLDIHLHDNATIGQLATAVEDQLSINSAVYRVQMFSDQNTVNSPYEETHRITLAMPNEQQINDNHGVQFFGKITQKLQNQRNGGASIQPDRALADYPNFVPNLIQLYDLALELDSFDLCSSIRLLLMILPARDDELLNAIKKQANFETFLNSKSLATSWYNVMTLRMILLPSDPSKTSSTVYQQFFSTNGPHVALHLLCSSRVMQIRHKPTRDSLLAALIELGRFVTLVTAKRDEIDLITQRKFSKHHQTTLTVLKSLDHFMFDFAFNEATKIRVKSYRPMQLNYQHFDGLMRLIWSINGESSLPENTLHLFKLAYEMFILFGVIKPLSSIDAPDKTKFIQNKNFLEFTIQTLLSQHDQVRYWTNVFLQLGYTRNITRDEELADPAVTSLLAQHLHSSISRCYEQPDHSEHYFELLNYLVDEYPYDAKQKLDLAIEWIEGQRERKETNDILLKGYLILSLTLVRALEPSEIEQTAPEFIKLLNEIVFPVAPSMSSPGSKSVPKLTKTGSSDVVPSSPRKLGSPLCDTKDTAQAAMSLLVELTGNSVTSLRNMNEYLQTSWHQLAKMTEFNYYPRK